MMKTVVKVLKKLQIGSLKSMVNKQDTKSQLKIDETIDEEYEVVTISNVGLTTLGMGAVILKSLDGKEFPISAFSGEVAGQISNVVE